MTSAVRETSLLAFVGEECSHCERMEPFLRAVEQQTGRTVTRLEVWHHPKNRARMTAYADVLRAACGGVLGVPAYLNTATGETLCGEQELETLLRWALRGGGERN